MSFSLFDGSANSKETVVSEQAAHDALVQVLSDYELFAKQTLQTLGTMVSLAEKQGNDGIVERRKCAVEILRATQETLIADSSKAVKTETSSLAGGGQPSNFQQAYKAAVGKAEALEQDNAPAPDADVNHASTFSF